MKLSFVKPGDRIKLQENGPISNSDCNKYTPFEDWRFVPKGCVLEITKIEMKKSGDDYIHFKIIDNATKAVCREGLLAYKMNYLRKQIKQNEDFIKDLDEKDADYIVYAFNKGERSDVYVKGTYSDYKANRREMYLQHYNLSQHREDVLKTLEFDKSVLDVYEKTGKPPKNITLLSLFYQKTTFNFNVFVPDVEEWDVQRIKVYS